MERPTDDGPDTLETTQAAEAQRGPPDRSQRPRHRHGHGRRQQQHHHHRRRSSSSGRGGRGGPRAADPFQPVEPELFNLSAGGPTRGARGGRAIPAEPGGDPRHGATPPRPRHGTSSSSSSSLSSHDDKRGGDEENLQRSPIHRDADGNLILEDPSNAAVRRQHRRHRRHGSGSGNTGGQPRTAADSVVVPVDEGDDDEHDYDPDNGDALGDKQRLLDETAKAMDPSTNGGRQLAPCAFQSAPIPYWVQRMSDLLLFHNSARSSAGPGVLPVDSAIAQLQADLKEARQLLREVKTGKDWGFMRTRPAKMYEVYGPEADDDDDDGKRHAAGGADSDPAEREMSPALDKTGSSLVLGHAASAPADVAVHVSAAAAAQDELSGGTKMSATVEAGEAESAPLLGAAPLLPAEEEAADEARPLLQREIPLWRRRGAAARTLGELVDYLDERLLLLERKLRDPLHGPWYESVGAPNSTGVDGTQRATLPPAFEQAYATTMTNAVLSDLFVPVSLLRKGLGERAARMSAAFLAQTPKVHDQFVIEEDFRPMYDFLVAKPANMLEPPHATIAAASAARVPHGESGRSAASLSREGAAARRSFTVHVDYIRLHPPPSPGMLVVGNPADRRSASDRGGGTPVARGAGALDDSFSRLLADTQHHASLMTGNALEDTVMIAGSASLGATGSPIGGGGGGGPRRERASMRFDPAAAAALSVLSIATAQKNALVSFNPEAYLIAMLLQHYERYRLLTLNLLPHLKARSFYEEQLMHLTQQQQALTPDMRDLRAQLELLRDKATELERTAMTAMIALWRAVLHLRHGTDTAAAPPPPSSGTSAPAAEEGGRGDGGHWGGLGIPFVVSSRRAAREAALAGATSAARSDFMGGTATSEMMMMHMTGGAGDDDELARAPPAARRRHVQDMEVFATDSASTSADGFPLDGSALQPSVTLDGPLFATTARAHQSGRSSASLPSAAGSLLLHDTMTPAPRAEESTDPLDDSGDALVMVRSARRAPRFRFSLRRVGHVAETPYVEGDDVLQYEPVVEGADALPALPGDAEDGEERRGVPEKRLDAMQFFQVVVFARASAAVPPQYVGCTMPRPLTAAKAVFFNESFEIRVLREPVEVILHVIAVSGGPGKGNVVATVRLPPTLTRGYLLLPLQAPVSFMFKRHLMARYAGTGLAGVLSASTTWTTAQGLSIAQIEKLFLSGAADPLNPEYAPLLRLLKKSYTESDRNEASRRGLSMAKQGADDGTHRRRRGRGGSGSARRSADTAADKDGGAGGSSVVSPGLRSRSSASGQSRRGSLSTAQSGPRRRSVSVISASSLAGGSAGTSLQQHQRQQQVPHKKRPFSPEMLLELSLVVGTAHGGGGHDGEPPSSQRRSPWTDRLLLMRHRWLIVAGQSKALDQVEATLLRYPIPLTEEEQYNLLKSVKRALVKEAGERRGAFNAEDGGRNLENVHSVYNALDLFDEKAYAEEPSSVSGLALSPLPKEVKLKLWQDRQRHIKLTRKPARHVTDEEKLGQVVTIPKFSLKLVFDLKPRSQFNPRRIARPKNEDIDRELLNRRRDSRIVVHVMKANHLPERADGTTLEPFVQVGFVYENAYSRCEVGTSPSWFQSLDLPFQPLDFEEETLSMIDDDIVVSVYDKVEIAMPPASVTAGAVAHETHYRTERRLLGTLRLPFYSLHQAEAARMEGVFPLIMPRWLLGYDVSAATRTAAAQNPFGEDPIQSDASHRAGSISPAIQLYISLWPPLQREKPKPVSMSELTTMVRQLNVNVELQYLHEVALRWAKAAARRIKAITRVNAQATSREVEPFVNCSTGDLVLACRYLLPRGGPPPLHTVTNVFEAIRFVSLLPFVVDIMTWDDKDVWSTNVELLAMRSGDYEELALLLAHFLRHLAPQSPTYVVVGEGEIYAQTIMVLHAFEEGTQWRLIDPRTGWVSPVERPFGTNMRDAHYVLSHDQMWANTQISGLPHRMTWDLHDPAHWLACFDPAKDKRVARCMPALTSIQRERLTFSPADKVKAKKIEVDLRAALKQSLLAWRNHRRPAFHRGVEAILRELLILAEDEKCTCGSVRHPAITAAAREKLAEYFGLPVDGLSVGAHSDTHGRSRSRHRTAGRTSTRSADRTSSPPPPPPRNPSDSREPAAGDDDDDEVDGAERDGKRGATHGEEPVRAAKRSARAGSRRVAGRSQQRPYVRLVGAPVTSSYSPSDKKYYKILHQVFECAAHEVGTDDVSFAAAVYVKSYTGDVFAMWVFLAAICRGVEDVPESGADA